MANTDFSILLKTILDNSSIDTELDKVQKIVQKYHLELTPELETASLKNRFRSVCNEMAADFNKTFGTAVTGNDIFNVYTNKAKQLELQVKADANAMEKLSSAASKIKYDINVGNSLTKIESLKNQFISLGDTEEIAEGKISDLRNTLNSLSTITDNQTLVNTYSNLGVEIDKVSNSARQMKLTIDNMKTLSDPIEKLATESQKISTVAKLQNYMTKNTAITKDSKKSIQEWIATIESSDDLTKPALDNINNQYKQLDAKMRSVGKLGLSPFDGIKEQAGKFTQWFGISSVVMGSINSLRKMKDEVFELDNSLLELSKVSDLSADGIAKITDEAYKLGDEVGKTGSKVIDAVTEFKRAGYEMQESMDMAKSALVMTNVADGISETSDAAGILISIIKGFNLEATKTTEIVDKINQVSNTSPIGFDKLAEGLQRTSGTMSQANTSIDQTIGLLTAGYAQLRNVERVSTGLITLSSRIRGVGEDGEVIDGLSATLQKDFAEIGVSIEDANGQLRGLYDIAKDYAKVLPTLTSKQKQYYAELAAGKREVTVWNAITQQFADAEKAVASSLDSSGSSAVENAKYLDRLAGKTEMFNSAFQKLSQDVLDSDFLKTLIDGGTLLLNTIDKIVSTLGVLGTIGAGAGVFGIIEFIKNLDWLKCRATNLA